jgi:hypothetical protein
MPWAAQSDASLIYVAIVWTCEQVLLVPPDVTPGGLPREQVSPGGWSRGRGELRRAGAVPLSLDLSGVSRCSRAPGSPWRWLWSSSGVA